MMWFYGSFEKQISKVREIFWNNKINRSTFWEADMYCSSFTVLQVKSNITNSFLCILFSCCNFKPRLTYVLPYNISVMKSYLVLVSTNFMNYLSNDCKFMSPDSPIISASWSILPNDILGIVFVCVVGEKRHRLWKQTTVCHSRVVLDQSLKRYRMVLVFVFVHTTLFILS